jgi:hypothetical protein
MLTNQPQDDDNEQWEVCAEATITSIMKFVLEGGPGKHWRKCGAGFGEPRHYYTARVESSRRVDANDEPTCTEIISGPEGEDLLDLCECKDGCCPDNFVIARIEVLKRSEQGWWAAVDSASIDKCNPTTEDIMKFRRLIAKTAAEMEDEDIRSELTLYVNNTRELCCEATEDTAGELEECIRRVQAGHKAEWFTFLPAIIRRFFLKDVLAGDYQMVAFLPAMGSNAGFLEHVCNRFQRGTWGPPRVEERWVPYSMDEYTSSGCQIPWEVKDQWKTFADLIVTISSEKLCALTTLPISSLLKLLEGKGWDPDMLEFLIDFITNLLASQHHLPECPIVPYDALQCGINILHALEDSDSLCAK